MAIALVLGATFAVTAQQQSTPNCPTVKIEGTTDVHEGHKVTFTARLTGGDPKVEPAFNWTVSRGWIEKGQGEATIELSNEELSAGTSVTAVVGIHGFDRGCRLESSAGAFSTTIHLKIEPRKVDEYSSLKPADEEPRLDKFIAEALANPTAKAYIVSYGGRVGPVGEALKEATRAKNYITRKRGFDARRVLTVDGGYKEQRTIELWLVLPGSQPLVSVGTVNPANVKHTAPVRAAKPARRKASKRKKSS